MSATKLAALPAGADSVGYEHALAAPESTGSPNPFVGLVPLGEQHAALLAGREEEIKILTTNLRAARLTLVYGASGVGKSSLLQAGVVATLRNLEREELNNFGTPSFAVAVTSSWAGDPFEQIKISIREGLQESLQVESIPPLPPSLDLVETVRFCNNTYGVELLVILDQFEEFFLYHEGAGGRGTFVHEFPRAVNATDIKARFLISLRDDSLYKLDRFQASLPNLFENRWQVDPLTTTNAEQAIYKACAAYNASPRAITRVTVDPSLVSTVLEQVKSDNLSRDIGATAIGSWGLPEGASKTGYVDAPYMQLVMSRLWEEESKRWEKEKKPENTLRLEALKRLGSTQAVVQQHLDKVMQSFSARDRRIASDGFSRLVTPGGSKYALTPNELKEWTGHSESDIKAFQEKLADSNYRIVRRVNKKTINGTEVAYEPHHDRLALAMRNWHIRYKTAAVDQKKRIITLLILGIILIAAASLLMWQYVKLKRQETAEFLKLEVARLKEAKLEKNLEISSEADQSDRTKLAALRSLIPKVTCKEANPGKDIQEINKILDVECEPTSEAGVTPRVYVHIQTEDQRETARELRLWLQSERYENRRVMVPGIENVGLRLLKNSELRYFHNNTYELGFVWQTVSSLKDKCVTVTPQLIKGFEDSDAIRPGHFELWLTADSLANYGCNSFAATP